MTVTIPTVDDFADTTVMRVIRKIVDYIRNDLVPSINDNDIERIDVSLTGQTLYFYLYKGDNSRITDTVSLSTFVTSSELATELNGYATEDALSDLQEQITAISPQLTIRGNVLTVTVNGDSSSVTLPTGDANPYPTSVDLSVSGNNLSINIPMSEGNALKDTVALPESGGSQNIAVAVYQHPTDSGVGIQIKDSGDILGAITLSKPNANNIQVTANDDFLGNVTENLPIINSVSGTVTNGKLKITVNGVQSGDIPLPESGVKYYFNMTPTIRYEGPTVIESTPITQTMASGSKMASGSNKECYNGVAYPSGTLNKESRTFARKFDLNNATDKGISNINITKFDSSTYGPYTGNFILHNVYYGSSNGALYGDITYQNGEMSFNPSVIGSSSVTANEWIYIKITENTTFEEIS